MGDGGQVKLDPFIDFLAGTVAGIVGLIVGFPFDTVKVRFQNPDIASKYKSTLHAITTIIKEEKISGLYKGITSPLATVALMNGLVFSSYGFLTKLQLENAESTPTLTQITLAGAGSGIIASILTTPIELIKIRQQSLLIPTTARQVAWQIFRESGLRGLYRGFVVTALRDSNYGGYFMTYEATCRYFSTPPTSSAPLSLISQAKSEIATLPWLVLLFAGGLAGVVGWVATFPLDVVKTRIQSSQPIFVSALPLLEPEPLTISNLPAPAMKDINPYRSISSTIINSYHTEGLKVFFRGLSPTLIRAIPVNMVIFAVNDIVVRTIS